LFLGIHTATFAQTEGVSNDDMRVTSSYSVLPDSSYTFEEILADKKLPFVANDSLRPFKPPVYWLRIIIANPNHFAGQYNLAADPAITNTFYYFDANTQKWLSQVTGLTIAGRKDENAYYAEHLVMRPQAADTVYVKMDVSALKKFNRSIKPGIEINEQALTDRQEHIIWGGWLVSMSVICFFFLSNLYLYFSFKDKSVLFYLTAQVGAMVYITGSRNFFPLKIFAIRLSSHGEVESYDFNNLMVHLGVLLIIYGFIQLTRSYLNTKKYLPKADVILQFGLYAYLALCVILAVINIYWACIESSTLPYDNAFVFMLVAVVVITCVAGYRRRLRAAGPFLLANLLPLTLITVITVFQIFVTMDTDSDLWLPNIAVVSDAVVFSVALVARTKLIYNDLKGKELETQQLGFELREIGLRHSLIELENLKIISDIRNEKVRNELLQEKLEANQRELASTTLYMLQKNELLAALKAEIADLNKLYPGNKSQGLSGIKSILQSNLHLDDDWGKFKLHFEQVHPNFFENLQAKHPSLTKNEIRLYAYFHINLSTKEIATLLNIDPASVRRAKTRLLKKMGHNADQRAEDEPDDD